MGLEIPGGGVAGVKPATFLCLIKTCNVPSSSQHVIALPCYVGKKIKII
jgi:hypothetical protein